MGKYVRDLKFIVNLFLEIDHSPRDWVPHFGGDDHSRVNDQSLNTLALEPYLFL
jgi:hypothetical protein